jgi:hypothetical protein
MVIVQTHIKHFACWQEIMHKFKNPARQQAKSLPNAQNKNTYASQLMPDLPTAMANSYKKQINTP